MAYFFSLPFSEKLLQTSLFGCSERVCLATLGFFERFLLCILVVSLSLRD